MLGLIGCGGSIKGTGGPDGSTPTAACSSLSVCDCWDASDRCQMQTTSCWCPNECNPQIECLCGGGQFIGCEDKTAATGCDAELARVQTLCSAQPFTSFLSNICSSNSTCIAGCLSQLATADTCTQIDCSFCTTCDCLLPSTPSAFRACVDNCNSVAVPLR